MPFTLMGPVSQTRKMVLLEPGDGLSCKCIIKFTHFTRVLKFS